MLEDRINSSLLNNGYQRVDSNAPGIYLFHRAAENELQIISVIRSINGTEFTQEQYEHILEQIKSNFKNSYPYGIKLISLIITANPDIIKRFATEAREDSHWIIDIRTNRLIIYENENRKFSDLQKMIEQLLTEEQAFGYDSQETYGNDSGSYGQSGPPPQRATYRYELTPATMGIIALNIVAFLITHYTPLFGGPQAMLEKGALSWYYVVENKEYYRILTSIFMHGDWSHLVNNMIVLLFVGGNLEKAAGRIKYLFIYFGAGILAGISSIGYNMWKEYAKVSVSGMTISIGASGAIFGVVGAILIIVIINRGRLQQISSRQMILFVILSLYSGIVNAQIDQAAHVGGFIAGIILAAILYRKPKSSLDQQSA